jgi:formate-dependent nitrite reductase membrane component NrfD
MHELVITRNNHGIDPSLHIWGGEIAVYLFLGGLVAGMMLISGYFILTGRTRNTKCSCFLIPIVGIIALSLGMFALFLDLEHKLYVWRMYTTFMWWSPMSWGAWILIFVYPILALNAIIRVPEPVGERFILLAKWSEKINTKPFLIKFIGAMSMIFGGLLGTYTGILLSAFVARPAWNTSMLWILFLVSGLSSAAAFIHLIGKDEEESRMLAKADNGFLIAEIMIILLIIVGYLSSSQAMTEGANLIISGPYAATFWVLVFGIGIVVPLIIQLYAVNLKIQHTPVAPILVMLGGVALRFVIVSAGQLSHWSTAVYHLP